MGRVIRMAMETGISLYFRSNRLNIRKKTMLDLGSPGYIHLIINEEMKWMFIQKCERDKDAFHVYYSRKQSSSRFYINAKNFLKYLSRVIGVKEDSDSLRFSGSLMEDGKTVFINLVDYQVIQNNL